MNFIKLIWDLNYTSQNKGYYNAKAITYEEVINDLENIIKEQKIENERLKHYLIELKNCKEVSYKDYYEQKGKTKVITRQIELLLGTENE